MKKIDKVALIYVKDGKVLTTLSKGKSTYYMPGGKREEGENDKDTLVREIKEELSVDIIENSINFYGTFEAQASGKAEGVLVKMTCYVAEFNGTLCPSAEIDKFDWFDNSDIEKVSIVDKIIFKDLQDKGYIK